MRRSPLPVIVLAASLASSAAAQTSKDQSPSDALKGPSVSDRDIPGGGGSFGADQRGGGPERARARYDTLLKLVNGMSAAETPPVLRLSDEQRQRVDAIARELQAKVEEFRRDNADDLKRVRDLRDRQNASPKKGAAPVSPVSPAATSPDDPVAQAERDEMMQRLQRLDQARPDPATYEARIWDVLTEPQRGHIRAQVKKAEDEMAQQRAEKRLDELRKKKQGASPGAPAVGAPPAVAEKPLPASDTADRRARLKAKIAEALSVPPDRADMIAGLLFGPPRESERNLSYADRLDARISGLPAQLVTEEQRQRLRSLTKDLPGVGRE